MPKNLLIVMLPIITVLMRIEHGMRTVFQISAAYPRLGFKGVGDMAIILAERSANQSQVRSRRNLGNRCSNPRLFRGAEKLL